MMTSSGETLNWCGPTCTTTNCALPRASAAPVKPPRMGTGASESLNSSSFFFASSVRKPTSTEPVSGSNLRTSAIRELRGGGGELREQQGIA